MISGPDSAFALPELDALLREELAHAGTQVARRPAGWTLLVQPAAANRCLPFTERPAGVVRMHVDGRILRGDTVCAVDELPWDDDSFGLVFAQHVSDVLPTPAGFIDEITRVLVPGGVLILSGLNPLSPLRAWLHWQARRGVPAPGATYPEQARRNLRDRNLVVSPTHRIGSCWPPRTGQGSSERARGLGVLRGAWVLEASKQRAVLTPLRPLRSRERVAMQAQLATPSRRASA